MARITSLRFALNLALAIAATVVLVVRTATAHSRLLSPPARWGGFCETNVNCPVCGYQTAANAQPSQFTYKRGQSIPVTWSRNNHPGGFSRISIVPYTKNGTYENFQSLAANVVHYACAESNCKSHTSDPLGPDGPGFGPDQNVCSSTLVIPSYLPDGQYTMQWTWQNVRSYFGNINKGLAPFMGCHDFTIAGGARLTRRGRCPKLALGDPHSSSKTACGFYGPTSGNPSDPLWCPNDGCVGKWYIGKPSDAQNC